MSKVKEIIYRAKDDASTTIGKIRDANREMNKELNLTQVGSQRFDELSGAIKDNKQVLDQIIPSVERYGKETSRLKDFIREGRSEHWMQTSMFREGREAMGAVSLGLAALSGAQANSSESTKKLTSSLTEGFMTFQGLSFMLSGAGPWGIAAAGAAGLAATIFTLGKETKDTTDKVKEQADALEREITLYGTWKKMVADAGKDSKQLSEDEVGLLRARQSALSQVIQAQKDGTKDLTIVMNDMSLSSAQMSSIQNEAAIASKRSLKENEDAYKGIAEQIKGVDAAVYDTYAKIADIPTASVVALKKEEKDLTEQLDRLVPRTDEYNTTLQQLGVVQDQLKAEESFRKQTLEALDGIQVKYNMSLQTGITQLDLMKSSLSGMGGMMSSLNMPKLPDMPAMFHVPQMDFGGGSAAESLQGFQDQIKTIQEQMMTLDVSTPKFLELQATLKIVQKKMHDALVDPIENIKSVVNKWSGVFTGGMGILQQAAQNKTHSVINGLDQEEAKALKVIDDQLKSTRLSEEERNKLTDRRAQVEEQYMQRKKQAQREGWEASREMQVFEAIINTARAVAEALPDIPLSIAVGALGSAQVAVIESQPTPSFHRGGSAYFDAPENEERNILIRGKETVRVTTPEQEISGRGGNSLTIHINGPLTDKQAFKRIVEEGMKEMGLTDPAKYFRPDSGKVSLS